MRVLIAGCGDIGSLLAERLVADGHEVHGLKRDPSRLRPVDIPLLVGDSGRLAALGWALHQELDMSCGCFASASEARGRRTLLGLRSPWTTPCWTARRQ